MYAVLINKSHKANICKLNYLKSVKQNESCMFSCNKAVSVNNKKIYIKKNRL